MPTKRQIDRLLAVTQEIGGTPVYTFEQALAALERVVAPHKILPDQVGASAHGEAEASSAAAPRWRGTHGA